MRLRTRPRRLNPKLSLFLHTYSLAEEDGPDCITTRAVGDFVRGPGAVGGSRERGPVPKESNNPSFMCAGSAKTGSPRDRLLSPRIGLGVVHHTLATKNK